MNSSNFNSIFVNIFDKIKFAYLLYNIFSLYKKLLNLTIFNLSSISSFYRCFSPDKGNNRSRVYHPCY